MAARSSYSNLFGESSLPRLRKKKMAKKAAKKRPAKKVIKKKKASLGY